MSGDMNFTEEKLRAKDLKGLDQCEVRREKWDQECIWGTVSS